MYRIVLVLLCLAVSAPAYTVLGQGGFSKPIAFPGAEGFGRYTTGGRGGKVIVVRNLNDHGPGSLREAIETRGPRIIVFAVSGTIALQSRLAIRQGNLTIAGQSAPGDGICLRNYPLGIEANNVIIRFLRVRLGNTARQPGGALVAIQQKKILLDHCSISWAAGECTQLYDNENFTLQWCIIAESLNQSNRKKGKHGYGGSWGGLGASFHHNLIIHHYSQTPLWVGAHYHGQPTRELVDFRNNVLYNWKEGSLSGGEHGRYNLVGNYYKPGPATTTDAQQETLLTPLPPYGKFYVAGNILAGHAVVSGDNWQGGIQGAPSDSVKAGTPFLVESIAEQSAEQAYTQVLAKVGASYHRDAVDVRLIKEVNEGYATLGWQQSGMIDSQKDAGGWPALQQGTIPVDTDADGMPDAWETAKGLNPKDPADASLFTLDEQFTNLELYLNALVN